MMIELPSNHQLQFAQSGTSKSCKKNYEYNVTNLKYINLPFWITPLNIYIYIYKYYIYIYSLHFSEVTIIQPGQVATNKVQRAISRVAWACGILHAVPQRKPEG